MLRAAAALSTRPRHSSVVQVGAPVVFDRLSREATKNTAISGLPKRRSREISGVAMPAVRARMGWITITRSANAGDSQKRPKHRTRIPGDAEANNLDLSSATKTLNLFRPQ